MELIISLGAAAILACGTLLLAVKHEHVTGSAVQRHATTSVSNVRRSGNDIGYWNNPSNRPGQDDTTGTE